jgi:pimeloyl-ACP methyl ester carboxylesterase
MSVARCCIGGERCRPWVAALFVFLLRGSPAAFGFEFSRCTDAGTTPALAQSLCASVPVPLRAAGGAPAGTPDTVYLFVRKFPAVHGSSGSVWLIAGGPGESGATFYPLIATLRHAFPNFDLLAPDHRGTGYSTRLCPLEEAIGSLGGGALVGAEAQSCWHALQSRPTYTRAFSISNAARDLSYLISQTHGEGLTYLYGVSYGTQLILRALQLQTLPVSAIVLDSLVPPESAVRWNLKHRDEIVNAAGIAFLNRCQQVAPCRAPIEGSLVQAYADLIEVPQPRFIEQIPGGDLRVFFGGLLDSPQLRARIPRLIAELRTGQTATLLATRRALDQEMAALARFPQSSTSLPLLSLIGASENLGSFPDQSDPPGVSDQRLMFKTPFPVLLMSPKLPLYSRDEHFGRIPKTLPPTLVIQGTLDPKTPFEAAAEHVRLLSQSGPVRLVAAVDSPHFVLMSAPECVVAAVESFRAGAVFDDPAVCRRSILSRDH